MVPGTMITSSLTARIRCSESFVSSSSLSLLSVGRSVGLCSVDLLSVHLTGCMLLPFVGTLQF